MKKLTKTTLLALILASALVAFRGPGPRKPAPPAPDNMQTPKYNRQQPRDPDTLGREVDLDSARRCVRLFAALAVKSRLTPAEQKRYPNFRRSKVNTTGEVFSGKKLIAWLQSVDALYDAQKLSMHLDVELGIYTEEFLDTYHHDDERLKRKLLGRVGIFILPVDSVSKWSIDHDGKLSPGQDEKLYSKTAVQHGPSAITVSAATSGKDEVNRFGNGPGGTAYDLGGIKP